VLYVVGAELSGAEPALAQRFIRSTRDALPGELWCFLETPEQTDGVSPSEADGVIIFLGPDEDPAATALLERARRRGAQLFPVALDEVARSFARGGDTHAFDVHDLLRRRSLGAEHAEVAGRAFAWEVLATMKPTCSQKQAHVFLCYRRRDGEGLVALVDEALSARHHRVFRDLVSIQAGQAVRPAILAELSRADVVVFLDSPAAGESDWVEWELSAALGERVPIVWVQLGRPDDRVPLRVAPADRPDVVHPSLDADRGAAGALADEILELAFTRAVARASVSQRYVNRLRDWAEVHRAAWSPIDERLSIYQLQFPAAEDPYPLRPRTHIVQVFGRQPDGQDNEAFSRWLRERGYGPHEPACRAFDAAVMLTPSRVPRSPEPSTFLLAQHGESYVDYVTSPAPIGEHRPEARPGLLLFGAFPEGALAPPQVLDAVGQVGSLWLRRGGRLTFGGHPTFTPLIVEMARSRVGGAEARHVSIYQSLYFVTEASLDDLRRTVTVVAVPEVDGDRDRSLTELRRRMVAEADAAAAVVVGGRTHRGTGRRPGVDEEAALAREQSVPLFILGATGGAAAELADRARRSDPPWSDLGNGLDDASNERVATTDDYDAVAELIWDRCAGAPAG
jgi:hypothetical protein